MITDGITIDVTDSDGNHTAVLLSPEKARELLNYLNQALGYPLSIPPTA